MKAAQIQTLLAVQANVITGLHEEYAKLLAERKRLNAVADAEEDPEKKEDFVWHAALYTPFIKRFKAKIEKLSEIQKALKGELKNAQAIEMWQATEDAEWLNLSKLAQQGGYSVTYSWDEVAAMFSDTE